MPPGECRSASNGNLLRELLLPVETGIDGARIFAVIVLYKQPPSASVTVATLARALRENPSVDCSVLIHDNSPASDVSPEELPEGFRYYAAPVNRGLYAAYEGARLSA